MHSETIRKSKIDLENQHFKPFCAIGYEYGKTPVQSGAARLGAEGLQFSIPQLKCLTEITLVSLKRSILVLRFERYSQTVREKLNKQ